MATKPVVTTTTPITVFAVGSGTSGGNPNTNVSTTYDLSSSYDTVVTIQAVTGATVTTAGSITIMVSTDNVSFFFWASGSTGLVANTTYSFGWELPAAVRYMQVWAGSLTGSAGTIAVQVIAFTGF